MGTFKTNSRDRFKIMIYESDGQAFENIFHRIMGYHDAGYQPVKAYGNQGDFKNDGYNYNTRLFYQVYAPEKIEANKVNGKLENDFFGLSKEWFDIQLYNFVINDKYKGAPAPCHKKMEELIKRLNVKGKFIIAKDIENTFLSLTTDQIQSIIGYVLLPTPDDRPNYKILVEAINHLNKQDLSASLTNDYDYPDWDNKLEFNKISNSLSRYLSQVNTEVYNLNRFLESQGNALRENLFNIVKNCYLELKKDYHDLGDDLFLAMVKKLSPVEKRPYHSIIKFFGEFELFLHQHRVSH